MAAVGSMFDLDAILEVIKLNKKDAVPMLVTFFLSVYGKIPMKFYYFTRFFLDFRIGIVAGIVLHIGMLIYNQNSPSILVERPTETDVRITLEHGIAFPVCEVSLPSAT